MKTSWKQILVLSLLATAAVSFTAIAEEAKPAPEPAFGDEWEMSGNWRPPEEAIDHMLERIKETDPEAAARLGELREDPEKFAEEFGKYMRENWKKMHSSDRSWRGRREGRSGRSRGRGEGVGYQWRDRMWQKHKEFTEWFSENYPEDANELEAIRETNPQLHMRKMMQCVRKYGKTAEAAKENPELAQVMKENIALKDERDEILKKLSTAEGDEKEALTKELEQIVAKRFDLIVKRKQLQHEQLLKKLEKLKERVKESETEVDKWKTSKDQKVKERVNELLGKKEEFYWD
ncbi:MAG: hypothetical protein PVG93_03000 [Phycisphaerales bacterium]|jgi:hypothetical protein